MRRVWSRNRPVASGLIKKQTSWVNIFGNWVLNFEKIVKYLKDAHKKTMQNGSSNTIGNTVGNSIKKYIKIMDELCIIKPLY